jgi:hypothetical protein
MHNLPVPVVMSNRASRDASKPAFPTMKKRSSSANRFEDGQAKLDVSAWP